MARTILIVDDNAIDRAMLANLIEQNYTVIEASSGEEMISILRTQSELISAILLDLVMPGMNGFEALQKIRDNVIYRQVPVIVVSAQNDDETQASALAFGAAGFTTKPYNKDILLHLLENTISLREKSAFFNSFNIDLLTGLMNKTAFYLQVAENIKLHEAGYYVMACVDVENFKVINDQYGLDAGDKLIKQIANNINRAMLPIGGICCHDTGDKFAALYPASKVESEEIKKLHQAVMDTNVLGRSIKIRVGRYFVTDLSLPVNTMYDRAIIAEESIKGLYDTYIAEYTEEMRLNIVNEQQIIYDMRNALESGEFEVWMQPQYNHSTGALIGAEALVRWRKDGKIITPDKFIPIFERNGFIYELDQYIWRSVCIILRRWLDEGKNPMPVSINISRFDILQNDFTEKICSLTKEYNLPADMLRLEVTESSFTKEAVCTIVNELIKKGFTVEIDDFGSGYSSLNTLKDVQASILKLDMRFFESTGDAKRGGNIVESVVRMAKWLGMAVIAEGVEDKAQADYLKSIGCFYIQGYLYAKPMSVEDYEKQLDTNEKEPQLTRLQTLKNLDNNSFWDAHSIDTLIFNSYVGAACIFEINKGKIEILRVTDNFVQMLCGDALNIKDILTIDWSAHMDSNNVSRFLGAVAKSLETKESVFVEYELYGLAGCPENIILRCNLRVIAVTGSRSLVYCLNENITAQRIAERSALNASERVKAVMDNSHCGISAVIVKPDGSLKYLFTNNRYYELFGYTREQYLAEVTDSLNCVVPEDRERVFNIVTNLKKIGSTASFEMRNICRDGHIIWLRCDISIVKFANILEPVQMSSFLDITKQKESELKEMENARQLEVIMANVNGGVSAIQVFDDATSKFVFSNDKYFELYGYTREQASAKNIDVMSLIVPEDLPIVMAQIKQIKEDHKPRLIDYRITKQDGSYAMLRANASLMNIPGVGEDVLTSVVTDITEKKSLEETLSAIVSNIYGGISAIYLKKDKPEYVIANEQYYRIVGYTKEEFINQNINPFDLIHPDDKEWVLRKFKESQKYGERYTMEYRIVRKDGEVRYILCNTNVFHLFGIDVPVQLAVSNDITDMREMQRKEIILSTQLKTIMKNINGGVVATLYHDKDNVEIVFSNDGFYKMYGYTKEQIAVEVPNILDLIFEEDRTKTMEVVERIVRERGSETYEYRCHKRDGSTLWVQCTNSVISLEGVGDTVLLAVTTDISALRIAQQKQIAVADRLSTVMNAMSGGMTAVFFNSDGKMQFLFANNRYYEIHGIKRGDIGEEHLSNVLELVIPKYRDMLRNAIHEAVKSSQPISTEYQIKRPDGLIRWVRATIGMTKLADIDAPVQVSIFVDITAEREASDQLRFLNDSARDILAQQNPEIAINDTLKKLLKYFEGERTYVFELNDETQTSENTYEVCASGVVAEITKLKQVPYDTQQYWFDIFAKEGFVAIRDVAAIDKSEIAMRELLLKQDIHSIIVAPLWRDDKLIGYIGVDNPSKALNQVSRLIAIADYVAILLTRRDLLNKINHDAETVQQLMDDTPGGFLRVAIHQDKNPTIVSFNDGFCQMLRMTREEVISTYGADAFQCLQSNDRKTVHADSAEAFVNCGQFESKCRLLQKNGNVIWTMLYGRVLLDEHGKMFLNAYFSDITEMLEVKENQSALLDNLPFGAAMYEFDGEGLNVIHINKQYWKLVGREPTEYEKTSVTDAIHPEDRGVTLQEIQAAIRQGRSAAIDMRILDGSGNYIPFHVTASIVQQKSGKYQLFAAYLPISNEAISLQEMLPIALSTMMETSEDISYIKGKDLYYIACSKALADMAGLDSTRDLIGKNAYDIFAKTFAQKFNDDDRHIIETGKPVIDSIEHIPTRDGGINLARTSKYPIRDASGDVIGVYCISHDVTAQRRRDSQLDLLSRSIPGGLASYSMSKTGYKTLYFNDGFFAFSGYTREEYTAITQKEPLALMFEEDRDNLRAMLNSFATKKQDGMYGSCDYRCHTKDGQTRYMSLKAILTQVNSEQFILNVVQFDMTQHIEIEQRMKNLLDNLPFGAAMYEFDGQHLKALHVNQQYQFMVGRECDDKALEDYAPMDYIYPDDRIIAIETIKDAIANQHDGSCNIRLLYGKNEYHSFHIDARVTSQLDGKYLVYVAYTRMSEQKLTFEKALPHIFSTIMESSNDIAFAKDINFRYICCSKTFATLLGVKSEKNVVGKTDYELFPREIADMFRKEDLSLVATQKPQIDMQKILPSPDGKKHCVRTSKYILRDDTDTVIGIYCIGRDITEIKEAYQQLRLLTDSIPGGIATFRCASNSIETVYYNDGVCELAGYSRKEYEANPIPLFELIYEEDRPIISKQIELMKAGEKHFTFILRIHQKNGGCKWVRGIATVIDCVDEAYILNAVLTDITEQQEEKERLRLAEEEYRIATSHSGHTIGRYDIATQTLTISDDASAMLSLPETISDVPYGRVKLGKISKATAKDYIAFYEKIMHGQKECSVTFQKLLSTGWRWINERATTIFDEKGKPFSAIISYVDVTEQQEKEAVYKKWQQNLMQKGPESYTLYRCNLNQNISYDSVEGTLIDIHESWGEEKQKTFNECTHDFAEHCVVAEDRDMYMRFLNSDKMLASYYRGKRSASIEFRGLVATGEIRWIRLLVELVEYPNTKDVAAYLMFEDINDTKLMALKTQTLAETDPLTGLLNRKTFIEKMDEMLAVRKGGSLYALILLDVDGFKLINDSFGHLVGDQLLIDTARAMQSVLRDSDLVCRMGGDEFLICMGEMPNRKTILTKTKQILELMHSIVRFDVKLSVSAGIAVCPDDGNTFENLYPKVDKALYHVKKHGKDNCAFYDLSMNTVLIDTDEHFITPIDTTEKQKMLIVDSNKSNSKLMANVFEEDFKVDIAEDSISALNYLSLEANNVSIVLLELNLPNTEGFTLLERMQAMDLLPHIPVVVVLNTEERGAVMRVIKAGASDFVTKPIDPTLLRIRVESAISKAENERLRAQNRYLTLLKEQKNGK